MTSTFYDTVTGALDAIVHRDKNGGIISSCIYDYDADGRRTTSTRENGDVITYGYDGLSRLESERRVDADNGVVYFYAYVYDRAGNRQERWIDEDRQGVAEIKETYTYAYETGSGHQSDRAPNMLMKVLRENAYDSEADISSTDYDYDANGNLTSRKYYENEALTESTAYTWDSENRLVKVVVDTDPVGQDNADDRVVVFVYCPSCRGKRSQRLVWRGVTTPDATPDEWLRYESEGLNEFRIDERYDDDSDRIDVGDPWRTRSYTVHGPGLIRHEVKETRYTYTGSSASPATTTVFYYHFDALGNVLSLTGDGGELIERYEIDAFGNPIHTYSSDAEYWRTAEGADRHQTNRRITGKRYDPDVGLYFFHARWYHPELGRFPRRDPLSPHGYEMSLNLPTGVTDPTGAYPDPHPWFKPLCSRMDAAREYGYIMDRVERAVSLQGWLNYWHPDPRRWVTTCHYWANLVDEAMGATCCFVHSTAAGTSKSWVAKALHAPFPSEPVHSFVILRFRYRDDPRPGKGYPKERDRVWLYGYNEVWDAQGWYIPLLLPRANLRTYYLKEYLDRYSHVDIDTP